MNDKATVIHGVCPTHGAVSGFLSPPIYAGDPRDPRATGQRWCSRCGLGLSGPDPVAGD
jgi:hypothetical protein